MFDRTSPVTPGTMPKASVLRQDVPDWTVTLVQSALVLQLVQLLLYDWLPESLRLALAGLATIMAVAGAIRVSVVRADLAVYWIPLAMAAVAWTGSALLAGGDISIGPLLQLVSFYAWVILLFATVERFNLQTVMMTLIGAIAISAAIALLMPRITYVGTSRLAPIGGGPHAAGMAMAMFVSTLMLVRSHTTGWRVVHAFSILVGVALLVGYQSRTSLLALAVFFGVFLAWFLLTRRETFAVIVGAILAMGTLFLFLYVLRGAEIDTFSSGRLGNYAVRIDVVLERGLAGQMFGSGPGGDFIEVGDWWGEKSSHNDFITALIERGWIGLAALLLTIAFLFRDVRGLGLAAFAAFMTMLMLNGVITRPLNFVPALVAMALGTAAARAKRS